MADILVIDDDKVTLTLVEELLRDRGHTVRTAGNGVEGLTEVLGHLPDLVILDLNMPEMNGHAFAQQMKSFEQTRDIPIVALTAETSTQSDQASYESGCNGFLSKPVDANRLYAMLDDMFAYRAPS
jgi:CheY-like chemotaxis protein